LAPHALHALSLAAWKFPGIATQFWHDDEHLPDG
jgi:hypothetical protein